MSTKTENRKNKEYIRRIYRPETNDFLFIYGSLRRISPDRDFITRNMTLLQEVQFHTRYNIKDSVYDPDYGKKLKARKEREKAIANKTYNPFN